MNARQCKEETKPGRHRVADTLYLYVQVSNKNGVRKSWVQRVKIDRKRYDIGLGPFDLVKLQEAKDKAIDNRRAILQGRNPLLEQKREVMPTFKAAAESAHKILTPTFRSEQHTKDWMRILVKHAFPELKNTRVDRITQQDVLKVLTPIWAAKSETARRVRQRIRTVLDHCRADGHVTENVADERINPKLPAMPSVQEHRRAMDYREMPDAVRKIETDVASLPARLCMLFLIHTAARPKEAIQATWNEIDGATWSIPGAKMKNGKPHRVPLSAPALALLEQARPLRNDSGLIFPSALKPRNPMTSATLVKNLKQIGLKEKTTVHGFRSAFKTWAMERTDVPHEVCEMALAHTVGDAVVQAYTRGDLLDKRAALMDQWAAFLQG